TSSPSPGSATASTPKSTIYAVHYLYELFITSLHPLYSRGRNLSSLTISRRGCSRVRGTARGSAGEPAFRASETWGELQSLHESRVCESQSLHRTLPRSEPVS